MSLPSEDVGTSTKKAVSFVEWIVEALGGKDRIKKLLHLSGHEVGVGGA